MNDWKPLPMLPAPHSVEAVESFAESPVVVDLRIPETRVATTTILDGGEKIDGDIRRFTVELENGYHNAKIGTDGWWYWAESDAPLDDCQQSITEGGQ